MADKFFSDGSQNVFGVSAESMQCAFDSKGNSVPMILLLMQERLYHEGGLKVFIISTFFLRSLSPRFVFLLSLEH
jgi:hypothetical protein